MEQSYFYNAPPWVLFKFLSQRPYRSKNFEKGSYCQYAFFILLQWVYPWIVFNLKIVLQKRETPKQDTRLLTEDSRLYKDQIGRKTKKWSW